MTPSIRPLVVRLLREARVDADYGDLVLSLVDRAVAEGGGQHAITLLPALACAAHGGNPELAVPACAAWLLVRLAAKVLDDVEDGDLPRDQPLHINAATGLLVLARRSVDALAQEGVPPTRVARIGDELSCAILRAAGGQHRDLVVARGEDLDPDGWLAIAAAKSGALFAWAAWAGAAVAGARGARLDGYRRFGEHLGALLQIADDYNDVWAPESPGVPIPDGPNLALAYARLVADDAMRRRLEQDLQSVREGAAAVRGSICEALTDLGGQTFVLAAGQIQRHAAMEGLSVTGARPESRRRLAALLDGVMPALRYLLDQDGAI